ncbi:hypothetical protein [Burkholderia thailandensis]|uniref:hypothetical protein n=1 Tax=Burkholderia thailandensis TaxID=57975 RepID=UPI001389CA5D|nr:hypothetical protein [Burkholderia thailandensis]
MNLATAIRKVKVTVTRPFAIAAARAAIARSLGRPRSGGNEKTGDDNPSACGGRTDAKARKMPMAIRRPMSAKQMAHVWQ